VISGLHRDGDEVYAFLRYYESSCGNCLPTFRDGWPLVDWTDASSRNVGKQLPHDSAQYTRIAQILSFLHKVRRTGRLVARYIHR
jgi:hypothetical protein